MAFIVPFIPYIAAGIAAIGSMQQSNQAASQQQANANVADYNAKVSDQNATSALQAANANEEAQRRKDAMQIGAQKASLAENGIDLTSGTGSDLVQQSSLNAELDALNIRYQGKLQATAAKNQGILDTYSGTVSRSNAASITSSAPLGAATSALTAYGTYAGRRS